jgi:hypothetical protein
MSARDYFARIFTLREAFRRTFLQADGRPNGDQRMVLDELRRFCYGNKPTLKMGINGLDVHASIAAAARQEVYMRIASMLNIDDRDLHEMAKNMEKSADG